MINFDSKKTIYFIVLFSLAIGIGFNEYNLHLIKKTNPDNALLNAQSTFKNETVWSVDDEFYISPPENFLAGKGWRRNPPVGNGSYFRRVPGYSLVYLFFRIFFDLPMALKFLKIFQVFLFGTSVFCVHKIMRSLQFNTVLSACIAVLFGCTPFFSCYTYYTCTEGITPYLCVFYFYFLIKAYNSTIDLEKKRIAYLVAGLFLGILILTRPNLALIGLPIPLCVYLDRYKSQNPIYYLKNISLIFVMPMVLLSIWTTRNFVLTKEIVVLEKASHPQSLDRIKPEFEGIVDLAKCWGGRSIQDFNEYYVPFQASARNGDTSDIYIENILTAWPNEIVEEFGKERLFVILKKHQRVLLIQKPYYDKKIAMPSTYFDDELELAKEYEKLVKEYKEKHFMRYWVKTPFDNFLSVALHSNTSSLFMFQKQVITNKLLYIYKGFLFLLHIIVYLSVFINFFLIKDWALKFIFSITPLVSVLFFCVIFRSIEQRYMLPLLPIMIIGLAFPINYLLTKRRSY